MEDETPWLQLASLALFKLFNDWQAQGFIVPNELLRNDAAAATQDVPMSPSAPAKSKQPKKMPENPTDRV